MYRLHIDIPLGSDEMEAIAASKDLIRLLDIPFLMEEKGIDSINYRLGHDDDRQKSNYLMKNVNGHVNNKKCKICYSKTLTSDDSNAII
jgi:hypothetical protein